MRRVLQVSITLSVMGLVALAILGQSCAGRAPAEPGRPTTWAEPMPGHPGLTNLNQVDEGLYRGAQPTAEGMRELERLGIRTVVNLRAFHDDDDELERTGLASRRISFKTWHPEDEDVVIFLRLVAEAGNRPIFVHCLHGSDRTGTMCAIYRIAMQGWSREDAIREMTGGGYGFHPMWDNLIEYLLKLDVERLKREAGVR